MTKKPQPGPTDFRLNIPPNSRYLTAEKAVNGGRVLLPHDADSTTLRLARYLRKEAECANAAALRRLQKKNPSIAIALDVIREPSRETAVHLESLVLARESPSEIASRCDVPESAVKWYVRICFCVGHSANNMGYILEQAIRPELLRRGDRAHRHYLMKLLSYFCGKKGLDAFFFCGRSTLNNRWDTPAKIIEKLAISIDLKLVSRIVDARNLYAPIDPTRMRKCLREVINEVAAASAGPWPRNTSARSATRILGETLVH